MNAVTNRIVFHGLTAGRVLLVVPMLLVILGCGGTELGTSTQLVQRRGKIPFINDFAEGRRLAAEKGMPCLLFFTAQWCTFCHQMEETAFRDPLVAQMAENFVCVIVDADREPHVCQHYSVTGYPTIQFVSSRGSVLHRLVGRQTAPNLAHGMRAALKRFAWLSDAGTTIR